MERSRRRIVVKQAAHAQTLTALPHPLIHPTPVRQTTDSTGGRGAARNAQSLEVIEESLAGVITSYRTMSVLCVGGGDVSFC